MASRACICLALALSVRSATLLAVEQTPEHCIGCQDTRQVLAHDACRIEGSVRPVDRLVTPLLVRRKGRVISSAAGCNPAPSPSGLNRGRCPAVME